LNYHIYSKVGTEIAKGNERRIKKEDVMKATQSFAQDRGTGATPAAGAKAGATQGTLNSWEEIRFLKVFV